MPDLASAMGNGFRYDACQRCTKPLITSTRGGPQLCFGCRTKLKAEGQRALLDQHLPSAHVAAWTVGDFSKPVSVEEMEEALRGLAMIGLGGPVAHGAGNQAVDSTTQQRIGELVVAHPTWGSLELLGSLVDEGIGVSPEAIDVTLEALGLAKPDDLWRRLEGMSCDGIRLEPEQAAFIERINPAFRDRELAAASPGDLLCQDNFPLRSISPDTENQLFLHVVVDTYSQHAFGLLHGSRQAEAAVTLLHNTVLPFFRSCRLGVSAVIASAAPEFWDAEPNDYQRYLAMRDIIVAPAVQTGAPTTGSAARFERVLRPNFFGRYQALVADGRLSTLRTKLEEWLNEYNGQQALTGFPNYGVTPRERISNYLRDARAA